MNHTLLLTVLLLAPLAALPAADAQSPDLALQPAHVIVSPWPILALAAADGVESCVVSEGAKVLFQLR